MTYGKEYSVVKVIKGVWTDVPIEWPDMKAFRYPDTKKDGWWLRHDFSFRYYNTVYTVKKGFDFDGSSIPRAAWTLVGHPLQTQKLLAALFHDILYCVHIQPRDWCDEAYFDIQTATGESWAICRTSYYTLRAVGGIAYPKTEAEIKKYKPFLVVEALALQPGEA